MSSEYLNAITRMFARLGRKIEPEIAAEWTMYFEAEEKVPQAALANAIKQVLSDPTADPFKLTVAKLMAHVNPQHSLEEAANEAWSRILAACRAGGSTRGYPPGTTELERKTTESIGGMPRIGICEEEYLHLLQARFIKTYVEHAKFIRTEEKIMEVKALPEKVRSAIAYITEKTNATNRLQPSNSKPKQ